MDAELEISIQRSRARKYFQIQGGADMDAELEWRK